MAVVELLEPVDVAEEHGHVAVGGTRALHRVAQQLVEAAVVVQPGERVGHRLDLGARLAGARRVHDLREGVAHGAAEHAGRQAFARRAAGDDEPDDAALVVADRRRGADPGAPAVDGHHVGLVAAAGERLELQVVAEDDLAGRHGGGVVVIVVDDDHAAQLVDRRLGHHRLHRRVRQPDPAQDAQDARVLRAARRPPAGAAPRGRPRRCVPRPRRRRPAARPAAAPSRPGRGGTRRPWRGRTGSRCTSRSSARHSSYAQGRAIDAARRHRVVGVHHDTGAAR